MNKFSFFLHPLTSYWWFRHLIPSFRRFLVSSLDRSLRDLWTRPPVETAVELLPVVDVGVRSNTGLCEVNNGRGGSGWVIRNRSPDWVLKQGNLVGSSWPRLHSGRVPRVLFCLLPPEACVTRRDEVKRLRHDPGLSPSSVEGPPLGKFCRLPDYTPCTGVWLLIYDPSNNTPSLPSKNRLVHTLKNF